MARSRNIKPAIMGNEDLAFLPGLTRLLFVYLWMLADREGRLEDRPKRIAAQALPYDHAVDVDSMLDDLANAGFILRYESCGTKVVQVLNFAKHQAPHVRESASELPGPSQGTTKAVPEHNLGSAEALPRSPDSLLLIPDSLFSDSRSSESDDSGDSAASASPQPGGNETSPMSAKETVWTLGPALLGDKARSMLGKLVATHGEDVVSEVLADCAREKPGDPKPWVIAACASRQQKAKTLAGSTIDPLAIPRPGWATSAGFANRFEAENAGCTERNHKQFANGQKLGAA